MNIIFVSKKHGKAKTLPLGRTALAVVLLIVIPLLAIAFGFGYRSAVNEAQLLRQQNYIASWQQELAEKATAVNRLKKRSERQLESLTVRLAALHARLIRLDALGEHLTKSAQLEPGEFDFSRPPALGGPQHGETEQAYTSPDFITAIDQLAREIEQREHKLEVLNKLLGNQAFENERYIAGRPVKWGWLSSPFGRRNDPFTGRIAWHEGVDFAGKENSEIIAVAAGVVTWAGPRSGYGNMVEIEHGGGLATRYAHANELKVEVGEVVAKGQAVASMGSTGRSTGPHVHYEVLKNGQPVNPRHYISRKNR